MFKLIRFWAVLIIVSICLASPLYAADMSQGLTCPPGWKDNVSARGNDLIKQCIAPSQDAFIELYAAADTHNMTLGELLDAWTTAMTQRGLPFQNFVSEQPGQVSGHPAVTRVYSGHTKNNAQFDSSLVASRYNGMVYIFQGLSLKGREQARQQVRHAMNTWYYPGASSQNTGGSSAALPLGGGGAGAHGANHGGSMPTISGTFISDQKDYWGGAHYYRIYQFFNNGNYVEGTKNAKTGKVQMDSKRKRFKVAKSGKSYVVKGARSCTDGYVTDTEGNAVTRFKSGCYSSGGKAMYFHRAKHASSAAVNRVQTNGIPKISGTFIADKKDYWGGQYYYRMYHFYGDGTYVDGSKNAASGKVNMGSNRRKCKISKSGNYYVVRGGGSCTDGYVTDTKANMITRFKSGCYSSGGKAMYFELVR